ncbi:hypothetical protein TNCV_1169641 [Trichonephila clavipes]|uniref:Uncharacterized protein n=1 Tax=Trichonephila clavipes TaxID=2585209 RepID=A0A8X6T1A0_TRICX|nr:hypothetical protein TNCV_1169641 [Trichonephila clavipes]
MWKTQSSLSDGIVVYDAGYFAVVPGFQTQNPGMFVNPLERVWRKKKREIASLLITTRGFSDKIWLRWIQNVLRPGWCSKLLLNDRG